MDSITHAGKIALVTGANKGIGYEVARQLGLEGVTVLVGARNAELGEAAAAKIKEFGVAAEFVLLDLTRPEIVTAAAEMIRGGL